MWLSFSTTDPAPDAQALMLWLITAMALLTALVVVALAATAMRRLFRLRKPFWKRKMKKFPCCPEICLLTSQKKFCNGCNQQE